MQDIQALVVRNDLSLEPQKVTELTKLLKEGRISFLSPDKEAIPFALYFSGDSLDTISRKTNYPKDIILLTAIRYNWPGKAEELKVDTSGSLQEIKDDIIRMMLLATQVTMQKGLADVLAGRDTDGKKFGLLPKDINGLQKLLSLIETPKTEDKGSNPNGVQVTGSGNQIQVNIQADNHVGISKIDRLKSLKDG